MRVGVSVFKRTKSVIQTITSVAALTVFATGLSIPLTGCDPIPRRELSAEEKVADLYWLYSQFGLNYAPKEYKATRYGFDVEALKASTLEAAKATKTNSEYYALVTKFVSAFRDAHTSISFSFSDFKGRAELAYLGFTGKRVGENFLVTELLPTSKGKAYPIKVGDTITQMDGKALADIVRAELVASRDLGHDAANLTFHYGRLFQRVSTQLALPAATETVLTVKGTDDKVRTVTMPWVIKDIVDFKSEQAKAKGNTTSQSPDERVTEMQEISKQDVFTLEQNGERIRFGFLGFDGRPYSPVSASKSILAKNLIGAEADYLDKGTIGHMVAGKGTIGGALLNSFRFMDAVATWTTEILSDKEMSQPDKIVGAVRYVPEKAFFLPSAVVFPAYLTWVDADATKGQTEPKLVGVVMVDSFSPQREGSLDPESEFKATLAHFQQFGVKDIVIDTINNGGGSLVLGMKMAQALSPAKVEMPMIQVRMNETWVDEIETGSRSTGSDAASELWRRIYVSMTESQGRGDWLSKPFSTELLAPYQFTPNYDLKSKFNVVLLTNEMCASMCDIFAQILQENQMAQIVGSQSMGAGGNVVEYGQAPNSHFDIRQTESLLLKKDGTYLENNGIKPDVEMDVTLSAKEKYRAVLIKAFATLVPKPDPVAPTAAQSLLSSVE